jgi:hypothetical protein
MRRLLLVVLLSAGATVQAQFGLSGEVGVSSGVDAILVGDMLTPRVPLRLFAHLEAELDLSPVTLRGVLDPSVALPDPTPTEPTADPGLSEAYALYRSGNLDLSLGLERLPLTGARLSEPFSLEPRGKGGLPQGVLGARVSLFLDGVRIRPAVLYQDDHLGGVLSVRFDLGGAEFEAHALYLDGAALGLSGSGLVGDLVLYGEGWLLADAELGNLRGRGALGLSGFWGDALWTVEAALAPAPFGGSGLAAPAFPQVGAQIGLPVGDLGALDATVGVGFPSSLVTVGDTAVAATASLSYSVNEFDYRFSVGPSVAITERSSTFGVSLTVVGFF